MPEKLPPLSKLWILGKKNARPWVMLALRFGLRPTGIWHHLLGWPVAAFIMAALLGAAWSVMSLAPPEFLLAKSCFITSAAILLVKFTLWIVGESVAARSRML